MAISNLGNTNTTTQVVDQAGARWRSTLQMLTVLFKSRVVSLLVLAAVGGTFLGAGGFPGVKTLFLIVVTGGMAASGAAGLNEYLEKGTDALMARTRKRPLVTGEARPSWVVWASILLVLVPSLAVFTFNPALAFWLFAGAFIYVGIYTVVLKPRTLLNIVIGGAAGSAAVLSGGAAAGNWQEPAVVILALLVFLWTPSHFWSLAILYRHDYEKTGVPMLPVQTSSQNAAYWVFLHTGSAGLVALLLFFTPQLGLAYLLPVAAATADMVVRNVRLIAEPSPRNARALFISSNLYLMIVLLAICVGTIVHGVSTLW